LILLASTVLVYFIWGFPGLIIASIVWLLDRILAYAGYRQKKQRGYRKPEIAA